MHEIIVTCREATIAALPMVPLFYLLNRYCLFNPRRSFIYLCFAVYLSAMYAAVGLPDVTYVRFHPRVNLIPFQYMFTAWESTVLNVLLFLPLGVFLPVLWTEFRCWWKTIGLGLFVSAAIETLQIFTYRATDVNDLMTNTLGTIVGYLIGLLLLRCFPRLQPTSAGKDIGVVFGSVFGVMFFVFPFLNRMIL